MSEEKDYSTTPGPEGETCSGFGEYCTPHTPQDPQGKLYILCQNCARRADCRKEKNRETRM